MEESIVMVASEAVSGILAKLLQLFGIPEKQAFKYAPFVLFAILLAAAFSAWFYISSTPS